MSLRQDDFVLRIARWTKGFRHAMPDKNSVLPYQKRETSLM